MRRILPAAALAVTMLAVLSPLPAAARTEPIFPILYEMGKDSSWEQGCFAPCLCPIMFIEPIRGSMLVTKLPPDASSYERFSVTQVRWVVTSSWAERRLTGSGTWLIGGQLARQSRLTLDLSTNQGPVERFDSGWIATPVDFPAMDMPIAINGFYCHDTGIRVRARPIMRVDIEPSQVSWDPAPEATGYDVVRGDLSALVSAGDFGAAAPVCLADDGRATSLADSDQPAPGSGFWYVARSVAGLTGESYDSGDAAQAGSRDPGLRHACP